MKISYQRGIRHNYMVIDPEELVWEGYESRMLSANSIEGLLHFQIRQQEEGVQLLYEITSRQPLSRLLEGRKIQAEEIRSLVSGVFKVLERMEGYLLGENHILLEPDYLYVEPESLQVWLCLVPGLERDFPEMLGKFLEYLLERVDHEDKESVVLAYGLYQETRKENYGMGDIFRLLCRTRKAGPPESRDAWEERGNQGGRREWASWDSREKQDNQSSRREWAGQDSREEQENPRSRREWAGRDSREEQENPRSRREWAGRNSRQEQENQRGGEIRGQGWPDLPETNGIAGITRNLPGKKDGKEAGARGRENKGSRKHGKIREKTPSDKNTPLTRLGLWFREHFFSEKESAPVQVPWEMMFREEEDEGVRVETPVQEKPVSYNRNVAEQGPEFGTALLADLSDQAGTRRLRALDSENEDIAISYYPFVIGKQGTLVDYQLKRDTVSRLHVRIDQREDGYQIQDLNSTNGTCLKGRLLENNEAAALGVGDEVRIANYRYVFE